MSEEEVGTEEVEDAKVKTGIVVKTDAFVSGRSSKGTKSFSSGDHVATALGGLSLDDVYGVAEQCLGENYRAKYEHLNDGMQRMNLGNRIRKYVNAEDEGVNLDHLNTLVADLK